MSCPIPFPKKMPDGSVVFLPCGRCLQCRIDKRNEWTWRLMAEIRNQPAAFLTLTIDDDNLLPSRSLYKSSVQRFMKRLRKRFHGRKFKYFFVGEYGELDNRPHYHAIIVGLSCGVPLSRDVGDIPAVRSCWPFGFIKMVPASKGSIRYVLKYMDKMQDDDSFKLNYPTLLPPFRLMSKGIGVSWLASQVDSLRDSSGSFFFDGAWRPLPRYYKERVFTPSELEAMRTSPFTNPRKRSKIQEYKDLHGVNYVTAMYELGKQALVDLRAKMNVDGKSIKK